LFSSLNINNNDILLDVGCGKGMVMMAAIEFNFLQVRGFDHSKYLCQICLKNLNHYSHKIRAKTTYKVAEKSALDYVFKGDETILYLFNPFSASITEEFIKKLYNSIKKRKRKVRIISRGWNCESVLNQFFKFKKKEYVFWGKSYILFTLEHCN
jgi:cyclopropane fatty-acyl-phospholipid synthase-like methyltransferase